MSKVKEANWSVTKTCYSYTYLYSQRVYSHEILYSYHKATENHSLPARHLKRPTASHKIISEIQFSYNLITNIMQWWVYQSTHKYTNLLLSSMFFFLHFTLHEFWWKEITSNTNTDTTNAETQSDFFFHNLSIKRTSHLHNNKCIYNIGVSGV